MDNLLLECIVSELRARLTGWPVFRAAAPSSDDLLVLFDDPARSRLLVSASADLPRLHLTRERAARRETTATAFSSAASHHLTGAVLGAIEKAPADRIVRFRFAAPDGFGKSLIAELLGRSSNLVLTDRDGVVLAGARRLKSEHRAPVAGASYEPPRGPVRRDPRALTREEIVSLTERSRRESHPLADLLLELCPALGALAATEIEARSERGEDPYAVLREWLGRVFGTTALDLGGGGSGETLPPGALDERGILPSSDAGDEDPSSSAREGRRREDSGEISGGGTRGYVYAEAPFDALDLAVAPAQGRLLLAPLPLVSAGAGLRRFEWPTLNEAADEYFSTLAAGRAFRARRDGLAAMAGREARRASVIVSKVARDLEALEGAGKMRVYAEALLAGLTRADRRGNEALVPDPYDPGERLLAIPIDPALPLAANAQRYFARHRKAERGRALLTERLAAQSERRAKLAALAETIGAARASSELDAAEQALREAGIAVGLERRRRGIPPPPAAPRAAGVRIYQSSDGWEILVGRGDEENDRLTFKIAAPEDFWLHASGASGAHVVVRNPACAPRLPAATLREAAELAAFYSKAKNEGRAEVLVTHRKHVRRIRGAARGTVTVKKKESVTAVPRNPFG